MNTVYYQICLSKNVCYTIKFNLLEKLKLIDESKAKSQNNVKYTKNKTVKYLRIRYLNIFKCTKPVQYNYLNVFLVH